MTELTYTMQGDYRLPNLTVPDQSETPMGHFSRLRAKYLKENRKVLYYNFYISQRLWEKSKRLLPTEHISETKYEK